MHNTVISVIVPIYNIEKYLKRCVESIIRQTYKELEIILVNDGSNDSSYRICKELQNLDNRIKVINKKNGGLSSARNAGLEIAQGEYIMFIDGDDTINLEMCEEMIYVAKKYCVDIVMCDYNRINSHYISQKHTKEIREGLYLKDDMKKEIFNKLIMGENIDYGPFLSVWVFMYKSNFLKNNDIKFDTEIKWSEDNLFSSIVGYKANSFYYLKEKYFYNYYKNDNSITTSYKKEAWDIYLLMNRKMKNYFYETDEYKFSRQIQLHILYYALNCIGNANKYEINLKEKYQQINKIINTPQLIYEIRDFNINQKNIKLRLIIYLIKYRLTLILIIILNIKIPKLINFKFTR